MKKSISVSQHKLMNNAFAALAISASMVLSPLSYAFETVIEKTYRLGDGDSRVTAREILIDQIKLEAANQAGTYIEADTTLKADGSLSESITSLSASLVKVNNIQESLSSDNDGFLLTVRGNVDVDENELRERIQAIQQDQNKAQVIQELQREKSQLLQQMDVLLSRLDNASLTSKQAANLMQEQVSLRDKIANNASAVSNVFQRGTLFAMSQQETRAKQQAIDSFKDEYVTFWREASSRLKPTVERVTPDGSNSVVTVKIPNFMTKAKLSALLGVLGIFPSKKT